MFMCRLKGNRAFIWLRQNNLPLAEDNVKKKERKKARAIIYRSFPAPLAQIFIFTPHVLELVPKNLRSKQLPVIHGRTFPCETSQVFHHGSHLALLTVALQLK